MGKLENKVAVITGGSVGIGKACVKLFVEEGARVIIADIKDAEGQELSRILGENAFYKRTDVTKESEVKNMVEFAVERFGRLDCIMNNAGIGGEGGLLEEISSDGFDAVVSVLFKGVYLGMKYAIPVMKKQKSGTIINTSSVAGITSGAGTHIYSACKAAVIQLTKTVSTEVGDSLIRINAICPGGIPTQMFTGHFGLPADIETKLLENLKTVFKEIQPLKKAGLPEDIAKAALWLASDDSSFVTGHALVVDGGYSLGKSMQEYREMLPKYIMKAAPPELIKIMKDLGMEISKVD